MLIFLFNLVFFVFDKVQVLFYVFFNGFFCFMYFVSMRFNFYCTVNEHVCFNLKGHLKNSN